jgi:exopolysaccharide biosynthesis protein
MSPRRYLCLNVLVALCTLKAADTVQHPFRGITHIERNGNMHIVQIDLAAPGIRFLLTPPAGKLETVRQTTLEFLKQEHAQVAINGHYFLPWPSFQPEADLVGFAASNGTVYSGFELPEQTYALAPYVPAINIDSANHATLVHRDPAYPDGKHVLEPVEIGNAVSGSAQIVTDGVKTIPQYKAAGILTPDNRYSATNSWYDQHNARSAIGITRDGATLVLFTVDAHPGMAVGEVAEILIKDFAVYQALNLDGGGSTTLAIDGAIVNVSSDNPAGRKVGSTLAIFADKPTAGK